MLAASAAAIPLPYPFSISITLNNEDTNVKDHRKALTVNAPDMLPF